MKRGIKKKNVMRAKKLEKERRREGCQTMAASWLTGSDDRIGDGMIFERTSDGDAEDGKERRAQRHNNKQVGGRRITMKDCRRFASARKRDRR